MTEQMQLVVLVKAAPVLTSDLEETMCVAGACGRSAPGVGPNPPGSVS